MENREYRFLQHSELRAVADAAEPTIQGYAAVFGQESLPIGVGPHQFTERIRRGAFARSLRNDIVGPYDHNPANVLARTSSHTMDLGEDAVGLRAVIRLPGTQLGRDIYELVKRGDLRGMSFSFSTRKDLWNAAHTERELIDVELREVSVVTFPAYPQTNIQARSIGLPSDAEVLTYAGVSTRVPDDERRRLELQLEFLKRL